MNKYIQNSGDEVAIVIYDAPLPPKYFRLTKSFIRTLLIVLPLVLISIFTLLIFWGLGSRLKDAPVPIMPTIISESKGRVQQLENELKALEQSNKDLAAKLASGPSAATTEDPYLMAIKKPYGMQNLLTENKVTLDQFELVQESNKVSLKFQIIRTIPEQKVTGHIIVFMVSESGIMAYPKDANQTFSQGIKYSSGEPFSVSRLRPTNAEFLTRLSGTNVKFIIYIFSREGDLLLIKETESFKSGAKS
jgi:hypothetical protein